MPTMTEKFWICSADPDAVLADTAAQLEARLEQYLANLQ